MRIEEIYYGDESIVRSIFQAFIIPAAICIVGAAFFWSLPARAQSLDCGKASTAVEFTICNDENLTVMDEQLGKAFIAKFISAKSETSQKAFTRDHTNWLRARNACGANLTCISAQYKARLQALTKTEVSSLN